LSQKPIQKGIEVELFGGKPNGEVIPLSTSLKEQLSFITQEPDQRNFEYITQPTTSYEELQKEIIEPRIQIRKVLKDMGNLTLIPGSTIPLSFSKEFYFSKPGDPYHEYICNNYQTSIITSSLHISFGIDNNKDLFNLLCALRLDTSLFLALSASSCFHDGNITGYKSYRWHTFPKTPAFVPFFKTHDEFILWTKKQLEIKSMFNVRHLWSSIRPNGPDRPNKLNRIEVRICDFISNPVKILGIVALIECLIHNYLSTNKWPKVLSKTSKELEEVARSSDKQEELAAKDGLTAKLWDWRNDSENTAKQIISNLYTELSPTAKNLDIIKYFNQIQLILEEENEATQFLNHYGKTKSIQATIQYFIEKFAESDLSFSKIL